MAAAIVIFGTLVFLQLINKVLTEFIPRMLTRPTADEKKLVLTVREQKHKIHLIDVQNEFAKFAKLQRQIKKSEAELSKKAVERQNQGLKTKGMLWFISMLLFICCHFWLVWTYRKIPIVQFPTQWLAPLNVILKFPTAVDGAIGLPCWMLISRSVIFLLQSF